MRVDEKDFFREATHRICSSLDIGESLWNYFMYIREYIPADFIFILEYFEDRGQANIFAMADINGGKITSIILTPTPKACKVANEVIKEKEPYLLVADRAIEHPIMGEMLEVVGNPDCAMMAIGPKPWMNATGIYIGSHYCEKYTEEHIRLFKLISEPLAITISNYLRYREVLQLKDILLDDNRYLQQELHRQAGEEIIGANFGLKHVMGKVDQVASLATPVLLLGETGVGKEVIATAIHKMSKRKNGPLIKVNCGAIPDSLMDSELFGHEKGAFTGAVSQKRGRFERADGGTIFLDEIGELTPGAQIRLLRVLQDKEIERVGGTVSIPLNIRVIAATHRNLEDMLSDKTFREDLFFRLNVFPIVIPPLRDRRVDIPLLIQYFITKKSHEMGFAKIPVASQEFIERLLTYKWPGNVRELQNTIEHALIASKNKPIIFDNFDEVEYRSKAQGPTKAFQPLEQLLAQHIREALGITGGKVGGKKGAAKLLNMNPSTLRSKMMKLNIPYGRKA